MSDSDVEAADDLQHRQAMMSKTTVGLLFALLCLFVSAPALAQAEKAEGTTRMVLLNVPGGGTEKVADTLLSIGDIELRDQAWFIKEIKKRGMTPKRIMSRPKDLIWIMQGGDIDYILYFQGQDEAFQGTVVGPEGTQVDEFAIDKTSEGISEAGLRIIKLEIEELLGVAASQIDIDEEIAKREAEEKAKAEEPGDPADVRKKAIAEREAMEEALSEDWIWARANVRMFKRDLVYAGAGGAVLTYKSGFYPGFSLNIESYPTALFNPEGAGVGVMLDFAMGFDSVSFEADNEGSTEEVTSSIGHMEIEGGLIYRLDSPIGNSSGTNAVRVRVKVTGRHERFTLDDERALPSLSRTTIVAGGTVSHPVLIPELAVQGFFEFIPFGFNHAGAELFGDAPAYTYGFSTGIGGLFELSDSFATIFGYRVRITRPSYVGEGTLDFNDTTGFELVQGLHLGILYQY